MNEIKHTFVASEIEMSGYARGAILPTIPYNSYRSRFTFPINPVLEKKIRIYKKPMQHIYGASGFVIDSDFNVYIPTVDNSMILESDSSLLKISKEQEISTIFCVKKRKINDLFIGKNGELYCITSKWDLLNPKCYLHCIMDGEMVWEYEVGDHVRNGVLDANGNIYMVLENERIWGVISLTPMGEKRWSYFVPYRILGAPTIQSGLNVLLINCSGIIYGLSLNGTFLWQKKYVPEEGIIAEVTANGELLYCTRKAIYSIGQTGKINWSYLLPKDDSFISSRPVCDKSGNIYIINNEYKLMSIANTGEKNWSKRLNYKPSNFHVVIDNNDNIMIQTQGKRERKNAHLEFFTCMGERLYQYSTAGEIYYPVPVGNGRIYLLVYYNNMNNSALELQVIKMEKSDEKSL